MEEAEDFDLGVFYEEFRFWY